jgi:glycosyltransferase involved in cell wall biosynthesis
MKILCICPGYFPAFEAGGVVASVHGLNKELVKKSNDVMVYATDKFLEDKVIPNVAMDVDGVTVIYFDFIRQFEHISKSGWQLSVSMWKMIRKHITEYDIVHIHSIWNFPVALSAHYCRKHGIPYVITPRGMLYPYTLNKFGWRKLPYYWAIARRDVYGASLIHYTTEDEAKKCHSYLKLKSPFAIIPNGIEVSEYSLLPRRDNLMEKYKELKDKIVILYLGRIHWIKGLDVLIKAFSLVYSKEKQAHLLLVGGDEGGYLKIVKALIENNKLNLADYSGNKLIEAGKFQVTYTGLLTGTQKLEAYCGSDIFVLSSYSENFGNTVIEAQICGLPVIISERTGAADLIKKWGSGMVVRNTPIDIANALNVLIEDKDRAHDMGKKGKKTVIAELGWNNIAHIMISYYKQICSFKG